MPLDLEVESVFDETSTELWKAIQSAQIKGLKAGCFRKTICCCQKILTAPAEWTPVLSQLCSRMLTIIASGELSIDTQIVASTAYLMVLNLYQDPTDICEFFFKDILKVTKQCTEIAGVKLAKPENFKLSLCHGLLQLNDKFWSCDSLNINVILFSGIVPVLQKLCYEYNALCYLSFRTLGVLLQKINNFPEKNDIISTENFKQILNIVMANWDNPLSGVREQNTVVFEQLLLVNENYWNFLERQYPNIYHGVGDSKLNPLLEIILVEQSWMLKSKYFLLSAIVPRYGITQALRFYGSDIISGLFSSLKFVHLVPAGTNLYHAILSGLTSEQWQYYFLDRILFIFNVQSERIQSEHIFSNWLPHTIKKFPEVLQHLLDGINKEISSINSQFSYVSLMRLSRKEGKDVVDWENLSCGAGRELVSALQCYSEPLRSQAFGYVCASLKMRTLPSEQELNLVIQFLEQNSNADNTAFRQNILNSMTLLLIRIRDSCLYQMRHTSDKNIQPHENLLVVFEFICRLHKLLVGNLEHGSNYQRKCTSVALYKIILDYLGKNVNITKNTRKSNTKNDGFLISNYGEKIGKWNFTSILSRNILFSCLLDPADDVRKTASEILISHFKVNINDTGTFLSIFKKGVSLCSSPMFYEAESGALIIKVVTTLTYNLDSQYLEEMLTNISTGRNNTVVGTLLAIAEDQTKHLMNDVLCAASRGSPVYGMLTTLENLLTEKSSAEFMKLTHADQQNFILLLEMIVKFILDVLSSKSSSDSEFAPSFGEMGLAVSAVAQSSSLANDIDNKLTSEINETTTDDGENFNLTPSEQLILNCLWLNIKVCCSLASGLIVLSCLNAENTIRCTQLLCLVLRKCRHKGAIESTGDALNRVVRYLTANDNPQLKAIPRNLLTQFLETVVSSKSATVSRRSAGLAILVHQLVSADMESGKPLLHYCVMSLIKVIQSEEIPPDAPLADLPQSQALHFLRKLVQDSSLRQDMASYILDISLLCFENLSSPIWTVRNAALQLFGGLVPKLVGQQQKMLNRQQQEKELTSGYHLAFEELFHHFKPLFELTKKELEFAVTDNSLQCHSKLMPMLTLLCNLTVNVQSLFNTEVKQVLQDFNIFFKLLLKSDIYNVRKLSAKASAWYCHPSNIVSVLKQRIQDIVGYVLFGKTICSENELHGYLLNVKYIVERFNEEKVGMRVLLDEETEVQNMLCQLSKVSTVLHKHSFTCQALISSLYTDNTIDLLQSYKEIAHRLDATCVSIGMPYWVNSYLTSAVPYCDTNKLSKVVKLCLLESEHYDLQKTIIKLLKTRIESTHLPEGVDNITEVLISFVNTGNNNSDILLLVLETVLLIYEKTRSNDKQKKIIKRSVYNDIMFEHRLGNKCSSVMLPVLCACIDSDTVSVDTVRSVIHKIRISTASVNNEDVRLNASKALKFILPVFDRLKVNEICDEIGYDLWQSTVNLLQDEDYDIRLEVSKFVSSLVAGNKTLQNPYISLQSVFKLEVLRLFMSETRIVSCLWSKLNYDSDCFHDAKEININPFDHGCVNNIYEEENIVLDFVTNTLLEIGTNSNSDELIELIINDDLSDIQMQCMKMLNNIKSDKNVSYINFKKKLAQLKIFIKVKNNFNELDAVYNDLEKLKYYDFKI